MQKKSKHQIHQTVGIIGSGQLALMMIPSFLSLGARIVLYSDNPESPAAKICSKVVVGKLTDLDKIREFLSSVEIVAFENEFVDCDLLQRASLGLHNIHFAPSLDIMRIMQDKLQQKEILAKLDIPCAKSIVCDNLDSAWPSFVKNYLNSSKAVLKWAKYGYDGKGTLVIDLDSKEDLSRAEVFFREAKKRQTQVFAEEFIPFESELALIAARNDRDEMALYPLVISSQKEGVCLWAKGPALVFGGKKEWESMAHQYAQKLAKHLAYEGVLAIEFFKTKDGRLLVNEIAPRVHNSGHYSQNAFCTSQFENHARALLGVTLGETFCPYPFVMFNLLGPKGVSGKAEKKPFFNLEPWMSLHWYLKEDFVPGRKMGHINATAKDVKELNERFSQIQKAYEDWGVDLA